MLALAGAGAYEIFPQQVVERAIEFDIRVFAAKLAEVVTKCIT